MAASSSSKLAHADVHGQDVLGFAVIVVNRRDEVVLRAAVIVPVDNATVEKEAMKVITPSTVMFVMILVTSGGCNPMFGIPVTRCNPA